MNPNAKIVRTVLSKIDVRDILNTKLYKDKEEFWVTSLKHADADAVEEKKTGRKIPEACTARFDINSFVYRARRPFHPRRLIDNFLKEFFMTPWYRECSHKSDDENQTEKEKKELKKEIDLEFERVQEEASMKQKKEKGSNGRAFEKQGIYLVGNCQRHGWLATGRERPHIRA